MHTEPRWYDNSVRAMWAMLGALQAWLAVSAHLTDLDHQYDHHLVVIAVIGCVVSVAAAINPTRLRGHVGMLCLMLWAVLRPAGLLTEEITPVRVGSAGVWACLVYLAWLIRRDGERGRCNGD